MFKEQRKPQCGCNVVKWENDVRGEREAALGCDPEGAFILTDMGSQHRVLSRGMM